MAALLKQSTTVTIRLGPFVDATDGVTEETGLGAMGVEISKNHGAFAARNSATATAHDAEGWYSCELNTTDSNTLGPLVVKAHAAATHLPVWREFLVVPANVYDSLVSGSDLLQADLQQWIGVAPLALTSQRVEVLVGSMAASVLTATAIAADAITAAKIAASAITSSELDATAIAAIADAIWDELRSGHVAAGSFGQAAQATRMSTAQAGAAGTITLDASASAVDSFYNQTWVAIVAGTGAGQIRQITAYVGATKVATISPNWATNPDNTSVFAIF